MSNRQSQFNETHPYRSTKEKAINMTKESPLGTNNKAALHGFLKRVRDLGLSLISICPGRPDNLDLSISKKGV